VELTSAQKSKLRSLGQKLDPIIFIGKEGVTPKVLKELNRVLDMKELVKLKFAGQKDKKKDLAPEIAKQAECIFVGSLGNTALYYRQQSDLTKRSVDLG